jgi:hypothetical protein
MRLLVRLPACLLALVVAGGCAGYRVGPVNGGRAGGKSIQVVPFVNRTTEPRLGDAATAALRRELQRDATFRLATGEAGDVVVAGEIVQYTRVGISFLPSDVITALDYRLSMTARVTARERATDKVLFDRSVTGNTLARVTTELQSAEREALPLLAGDLAGQITSLLADGDWQPAEPRR